MDNMQKGFLIAGGLLILGFLGYTLFGKKEEEIEDAEYYIVVETNTEQTKVAEKKKASTSQVSDELTAPEFSIVKTKNLELEEVSKETNNTEESISRSFLKENEKTANQEIPKMKVVLTPEEIETKEEENLNELEVVEPQELMIEANDEFPLKLGSKGKRIWDLKVYLMKNHGGAGIVTNDFDKQTQERVQRFLKVDEVSEQLYNKLVIGQPRKKKRNATKKEY